jgi:hypothetical protein
MPVKPALLEVEVRDDPNARASDLVGALATLVLARAQRQRETDKEKGNSRSSRQRVTGRKK